ncbi:VUT family protein [Asticcacaulis sp.]|uniref:VUT family protein n=1 Tax=Asticcacaulis sp. TaxID=1872648 RepID=UPI003F7B7F86
MIDAKAAARKAFTGRAPWTYLYLFLIPFINWCWGAVPTVPLPDHGEWTPMAIVTGLVLVVRDFAQREVGHWIFIPLIVGISASYFTSPSEIATASAVAFAISETVDWALFTFLKLPLSKRVFISAAIGSPIDTTVFYLMASAAKPGIFNIWAIGASILSKLVGCVIVYLLMKNREQKAALAAT